MKVKTAFWVSTLALGAGLVPVAATAVDPHEDAAAVKQLFNDFSDAFNHHDAQAIAALCTENVDFIVIGGEDFHGHNAVVGHLQPLFAGRLKDVERPTAVQEVRFLRPDVAVVVANFETRGINAPDGTSLPPSKGVYDWVVVRNGSQWRIALWHEADLPAQALRP